MASSITKGFLRLLAKLPGLVLFLVTLGVLGYVVWYLDSSPRTDDAYVYADTVDVTAEVTGRIMELPVRDNQLVKKGDLLFRIDARTYEEELARAKASLVALDKQIESAERLIASERYQADSAQEMVNLAETALRQAEDTLNRIAPLLKDGYVSDEEVDQARTAYKSAESNLVAAEFRARQASSAVTDTEALMAQRDVILAEIALMQLRLDMTTVRAPFDGRVTALKTSVGHYASPLKPVFTLIDTENWYIIANIRETDLKHIRAGVDVTVFILSDSSRKFHGTVDSIGFGVLPDDGGLVIGGLPRVQRSINWVRVAQRFPVKIRVDKPDPELFRVGASAVVVINPKGGDEKPKGGVGR